MHKFLIAAGAAATAVLAGVAAAQPAPGGGPGAFFAQADANHDGAITRAEWDNARAQRFAQQDVNHDGQLSADERPHWGGGNGGPPPGGGEHHGGMMNADANGDGVVTRAEYDQQSAAMFQHLDTDGDGTISASEQQAARERMQQH